MTAYVDHVDRRSHPSKPRPASSTHIAGSDADFESALSLQAEWARLLGATEQTNPRSRLFEAGSGDGASFLQGKGQLADQIRAWSDTYYVWLNAGRGGSSLSISPPPSQDAPNPPPTWIADLEEDSIPEDPTSGNGQPVFHGYSKPGSASGPVVYAGFCSIDDFALLRQRKINITGAITLCRYGGPFRGLKVRASAMEGAVGTLLYSDPLEDANITEANGYKAYPLGPARHPSSVQRGSVQALSFYPGDPATPGLPSYRNASRLSPEEADSLPSIPSIPISFANARHILQSLAGHGINGRELETPGVHWVGKVPGVDEYWTGPSVDIVHMDNDVNAVEVKPIWNSYAMIPGQIQDEVIIVGNHRDAWTFGGADPSSGTAAMHELVAGLGSLTRKGWRPLRSILLASWDGEEYGLVGSTEFGEDYSAWLQSHAAVYLNTDVAAAGSSLKMLASPSLARHLKSVASLVEDPEAPQGRNQSIEIEKVGPLGSGSDFSVFLQHLGIASSDIGYAFSPNNGDAVYHYHSNYDSTYWMEQFGDPHFKRITTIARLLGLAALRAANSPFLPINVLDYSKTIRNYVSDIARVAREKERQHQRRYTRSRRLNFCRLKHQVSRLEETAARVQRVQQKLAQELDLALSHSSDACDYTILRVLRALRRVNKSLRSFEQQFIDPKGLKDRPWYRSLLVGPGRWLGYGATELPGITEAIKLDDDWHAAQKEIRRLEDAVAHAVKVLRAAIH